MGTSLRVLFVTNSLAHGGAERHAITLMNRLAERGHECHATYIKGEHGQRQRILLQRGGTVQCLDAERYFDRRALQEFATQIEGIRPSVIVAANEYALMYSTLARRRAQVPAPLLVTYHSARLFGAKEPLKMLAYRALFWSAECTVFVCDRQWRYWRRRGVFSRRNEVIYNGVDTEEFRGAVAAHDIAALRRSMGFSTSDFVVGMAAGLRPEKNHVQLVEAIARLRGQGIAARALLIGDGEMRPMIEARARHLGVDRDIVITGYQSDVRPWMMACDAIALCSHTEALSLAAIEAMAMRKPVVHSDVGGAAELIFPGWNGFLFPVCDTAAFVDKLATLANRGLSRRMGENARAVAERLFSESRMVDRYEQVLLELSGA
ncbi:MAG TPA: glycosyltransferase family 4 protein [Steroidobacteraceae bacterium]|nr:glycosyltransferase family 4 protein [Steroidobacteraceae bacterium]